MKNILYTIILCFLLSSHSYGEWMKVAENLAAEEKKTEIEYPDKISSSLPPCPEDESVVWNGCVGELIFDDKSWYVGEIDNDAANGQGTMLYPTDNKYAYDLYVGELRDDLRNGQGTMTHSNDDGKIVYVGEWQDDLSHGTGVIFWPNGDWYIGEYKENKKHGEGTYNFKDGKVDFGEWKAGELVNKIDSETLYFPTSLPPCPEDENVVWNNCLGRLYFDYDDGVTASYLGEIINDVAHGQGIFTFSNGDAYVGEFLNNMFQGQGTMILSTGEVYVGEFQNDLRSGQGSNIWIDGMVYIGQYQNDLRYGQGKNISPDGEIKVGEWENDALIIESPKEIKGDEIFYDVVGTGFSVSESGDVITNFHVIEECDTVNIIYNGNDIETTIAAIDQNNDLALLKGNFEPDYFFTFDDKPIEPRTLINVAGFPHGYDVSTIVVVNKGIISSPVGIDDDVSRFRIDAPIQPGNSGGPVFDKNGNALGVVVEGLNKLLFTEVYDDIPENTNFAIKGYIAKDFLKTHGVKLEKPRKKVRPRYVTDLYMNATHAISCGVISKKNKFIEIIKKIGRIIKGLE